MSITKKESNKQDRRGTQVSVVTSIILFLLQTLVMAPDNKGSRVIYGTAAISKMAHRQIVYQIIWPTAEDNLVVDTFTARNIPSKAARFLTHDQCPSKCGTFFSFEKYPAVVSMMEELLDKIAKCTWWTASLSS